MHVCLHTDIFTSIQHICMSAFIHTSACIHTYTYTCIHTCRLMDVCVHSYMCGYKHTYRHIHLYVHRYVESCMPVTHIQMLMFVYIYACIRRYISHTFQCRRIHYFSIKYFDNLEFLMFPIYPDWKYGNLIIFDVQKFCRYGS